jgi:hypothetical protein
MLAANGAECGNAQEQPPSSQHAGKAGARSSLVGESTSPVCSVQSAADSAVTGGSE